MATWPEEGPTSGHLAVSDNLFAFNTATQTVDGWAEPDALTADNPLSMVPTLVLDDGSTLFDSPVICEFLDQRHRGARMLPSSGEARWLVLRD